MISSDDKVRVSQIAAKYGVSKVYLFGSSIDPERAARDIDLGVEGISEDRFFEFYGELILSLSKPVDLIDLRRETSFNQMVRNEGILLYG